MACWDTQWGGLRRDQGLIVIEVIQARWVLSSWLVMDESAYCYILVAATNGEGPGVSLWAALCSRDKWLLICIGDFP